MGAESFNNLDNILWELDLLTWRRRRPISLTHTAIEGTQRRDCGSTVSVPAWCCPARVSGAKYDFSEKGPGLTRIKSSGFEIPELEVQAFVSDRLQVQG